MTVLDSVKPVRIIIVGFGNMGHSLVRMISQKRKTIQFKHSIDILVTGILDLNYNIIDKTGKGLNIEEILTLKKQDLVNKSENLSYDEILQQVPSDIVVELTSSTPSGEPGLSNIQKAFQHKKHVVTSNKSPLVLNYHGLMDLARQNGCRFRFEGTVGGVIPIFTAFQSGLSANEILKIEGIFNGTTNYILTRMSEGLPYQQALEGARKLGLCETNPYDDISGLDAARKLVIVANVLMDAHLTLDQVKMKGIEQITEDQIVEATLNEQVIKQIASVEAIDNGKFKATVEPKSIDISNPMAHVDGAMNAIQVFMEYAGEITLTGIGAGPKEVSSIVLSDILYIGVAL